MGHTTTQTLQAKAILKEFGLTDLKVRCQMFRRVDSNWKPFAGGKRIFYEYGDAKTRTHDDKMIERIAWHQDELLMKGVSFELFVLHGRVSSMYLTFGYGRGEVKVIDCDQLHERIKQLNTNPMPIR